MIASLDDPLNVWVLAAYLLQGIELAFFAAPSAFSTKNVLRRRLLDARAPLGDVVGESPIKALALSAASLSALAISMLPLVVMAYPPFTACLQPLLFTRTRPVEAGSALFLTAGSALTFAAALALKRNVSFNAIGEAERLETGGVYGLVRNPIAAGLGLIFIGLFLALPSWLMLAGFFLFAVNQACRTEMEEAYLTGRFGERYRAYRENVGRFLPKRGRGKETAWS